MIPKYKWEFGMKNYDGKLIERHDAIKSMLYLQTQDIINEKRKDKIQSMKLA